MPKQSFQKALTDIQKKNFSPVYFFQGDEAYFIDILVNKIENNALTEAQRSFNQSIVYGKDIADDPGKVIDMALRLPMMAEFQVVIIKEAQNIKKWDVFQSYIEKPTPTTILVFAHKNGKIDGRSSFAKQIAKHGVLVTSDAIKDYKIASWIEEYVHSKGFTIDNKSSELLAEFLGTDIKKIVNELEKLFLVMDGKHISPKHIEKNIGISKDYNAFELNNAIINQDVKKAYQILEYFTHNPKAGHIAPVIGSLFYLFSKFYLIQTHSSLQDSELAKQVRVNPYFLKDYKRGARIYNGKRLQNCFRLLKEYDLRSKGVNNVNISSEELLKELTYKIMLT